MPYIIPCHQLRLDGNGNIDNDANTLEEIVISLAEKIEWNTKEEIVYRLSDEIEQLEDRIKKLEQTVVTLQQDYMNRVMAPYRNMVEPPIVATKPSPKPQPKKVM